MPERTGSGQVAALFTLGVVTGVALAMLVAPSSRPSRDGRGPGESEARTDPVADEATAQAPRPRGQPPVAGQAAAGGRRARAEPTDVASSVPTWPDPGVWGHS